MTRNGGSCLVDRRGLLDQTRHSAFRLIWWSVPVNLTWSGTSDQVTVIIIYINTMHSDRMSCVSWVIKGFRTCTDFFCWLSKRLLYLVVSYNMQEVLYGHILAWSPLATELYLSCLKKLGQRTGELQFHICKKTFDIQGWFFVARFLLNFQNIYSAAQNYLSISNTIRRNLKTFLSIHTESDYLWFECIV